MAGERRAPHYPIFADLTGRLVVVFGGGSAAERKVQSLLRCAADVTIISPTTTESLRQLEADGKVVIEPRSFEPGDLGGALLAICAGVDAEESRAVFSEAERLGCFVNVSGDPTKSSFLIPSGVRRGLLQIAISTAGEAPALAKRVKHQLRDEFGDEWGALVELLWDVRVLAVERFGEPSASRVLDAIAAPESGVLERLAAGEALDAVGVLAEFESAAEPPAWATDAPEPPAEAAPDAPEPPAPEPPAASPAEPEE